jgi:hypothetical protein
MINTGSPLTIKRETCFVSPYVKIPENIGIFGFDSINIDEKFILINIAHFIFEAAIDKCKIHVDKEKLASFISNVSQNYHNNSFHNFQHAINVLQMTWVLLNETNLIIKFKPHILLGLLISSLCHDIDHPGNTNLYEINAITQRALIYNDLSVLENHHCAFTFELIIKNELQKCFSQQDFKEMRKTIITCILGTDMAKHNEIIEEFTLFDISKHLFTLEEQIFIAKIILHYADLSNIIKSFDISLIWSKRILLEYNRQALKEELEGLPVLSFMKAQDDICMCINEINFIKTITQPMWKLFTEKLHGFDFINVSIESNLNNWEETLNDFQKENSFDNI